MPYNVEELSSPDPLQDSPTYSSPVKTQTTTRTRRSLPLQGSSPRKQTFELDVGNRISPQKIRVTVEAEHSDQENGPRAYGWQNSISPTPYRAPTIRRKEKTTTTTIPVKGLSDSEDDGSQIQTPKRGRGRPRKSAGTPVPIKSQSRNVTAGAKPSPRRRRTLGSLVDGDDDEDWDFAIGAGVEVGRGKGRPRSRSVKSNTRKTTTPAPQSGLWSDKLTSSAGSKKGRGRRKTLTPGEVFILEDESDAGLQGHPLDQMDDFEGRALVPVTGNAVAKSSQPSTMISAEDRCDMPLSKFTPARKILANMGQSNLQSASKSPTGSQRSIGTESSHDVHQDGREVAEWEETTEHWTKHANNLQDESHGEEGDALGDLPEFDTILESEGFSMISVESVPSLREHLSSPVGGLPDNKNNTPVPFHKTIASLIQTVGTAGEDSFSTVAPEILEAATPGGKRNFVKYPIAESFQTTEEVNSSAGISTEVSKSVTPGFKPRNNKLLSVKGSERIAVEDSFSSIPPEVFEAATPARLVQKSVLQNMKLQESRANEDSFSTIPSDVLEAATPGKPKRNARLSNIEAQAGKAPSEPFSSVPSAVFEATIPARNVQISSGSSGQRFKNVHRPTRADSEPLVPEVVGDVTSNMKRATSRLLTPEETPSPPQEVEQQQKPASSHGSQMMVSEMDVSQTQNSDGSSLMYSRMNSSPPSAMPARFTNSIHLSHHQLLHPTVAQTPSILFSSPSLPPLVQQQPPTKRNQHILNFGTGNSHEASIVPSLRAGKALQDLAVPSSTRSRTQSLGSPFKSPVARRSSSAASSGVMSSEVSDGSVRTTQGQTAEVGVDMFGGFSDDARKELRKSFVMGEELARSQDSTQTNKWSSATSVSREEDPFNNSSQHFRSPPAEEKTEYTLELPSSSRVSKNASSRQPSAARGSDAMSWQPEKTALIKGFSDDGHQASQDPVPIRKYNDAPRTSELYSGLSQMWKDDREEQWARERAAVSQQIEAASTSQVIVLSSDDSTASVSRRIDSDEEDIWQAEARHSSSLLHEQSQQQTRKQEPAEKLRRSKIPSLPRKNSKPLTDIDESSQASMEPVAGTKVVFPSQLLPKPQSKDSRHDTQWNELRIEKRRTLFNNGMPKALTPTFQEIVRRVDTSTRPISDEDGLSEIDASFYQPIPQKMNFAPRPRAKLDLSALLASSPVKHRDESSLVDASAALRSQLLGGGGDEIHNSTAQLRPSPDKIVPQASSPTFENFDSSSHDQSRGNRSNDPTNESVSGKFDSETESSILSEELSQDDSTDNSAIHYPAEPGPLSPNRSATPSKSCLRTPSTTSPAKSVAWQSPTPSPPPLSGTTWSKAHWKLLDALWKDYLELGPECFGNGEAGRTSKYVGKTVEADGEVLKLEPWHLDIVAAFRDEVPGWEEHLIAFRLFALIVGERQRRERNAEAFECEE